MALVAPQFRTVVYAQDMTDTITVPADTTGWTMTATLYGYEGADLVTKTVGGGITHTPGAGSSTVAIAWSAANLTQPPGLYTWRLSRTNVGAAYPIVEPSGFLVGTSGAGTYPRLTNLATYFAALGLSESSVSDTDAKKHLWHLAAAESALKKACRRQFTYAVRTEYPVANWQRALILRETPVESITSLHYDPSGMAGQAPAAFGADTLKTLGEDYYLDRDRGTDTYSDSGLVYRVGGVWTGWTQRPYGLLYAGTPVRAPGAVKVVYAGGYGNAVRPPEDLLNAIFQTATLARLLAADGRLEQSFSGEGQSVSFGPLDAEATRLGSVQWAVGHYGRVIFA